MSHSPSDTHNHKPLAEPSKVAAAYQKWSPCTHALTHRCLRGRSGAQYLPQRGLAPPIRSAHNLSSTPGRTNPPLTGQPFSSAQRLVVSAFCSPTLKFVKADECAHPEHASHRIKVSTPPGRSISCCQLGTAVSSPALYSLAGCLSPDRHTYCILNSQQQ